MPTPYSTTLSALDRLQRALKDLTAEELDTGRFNRAQEVIRLLQHASEFRRRLESAPDEDTVIAEAYAASPTALRTPRESETPATFADHDFPRFFRRGRDIVKVGLKRDKSDTYEQKLGRREFDDIGAALTDLARRGGTFEAQDVISQTRAPSYLVYLMLGLLQEYDLVQTPTRGDYEFDRPLTDERLDELWHQVPPA